MKEIGKVSTDFFSLSVVKRRQFIGLLLSIFPFAGLLTVEAKKKLVADHFYFADLKQGQIVLPDDSVIERGQPGSLMKLIAAVAILEENLPASSKTIDCRGAVIMHGQHYICRYPHGRISLTEAIGQSCNVFFAHASQDLNSHCFLHYLKKFGLEPSNRDANTPILSTAHGSVNLILGIADGFVLSATQILQMVALIAMRGKLTPLYFDNHSQPKIVSHQLHFAEHTWNVLQTGMQIACARGTAKNLDPHNKFRLAVKTGTTSHGRTFQSWLAGYFPYESPRYAFCLRAKAGTSYDQAVPLAKKYLLSGNWALDLRSPG